MITFFTLPKPFTGEAKIHQHNAIKSWTLLNPKPEIILFGVEEGIADCAAELGVQHVPDLNYNKYGTPLLNSAFDYVEQSARNSVLCYINADIIVLPDFLSHIQKIKFNKYLIVGQRLNIDLEDYIDFSNEDWHKSLAENAQELNNHSGAGSDYFVFQKGSIKKFPPFAVGRPVWDNWMIYYFRKRGFPVINASKDIAVIHQNHDYTHVKSGNGNMYWGAEAEENIKLYGHRDNWFGLWDSSHYLKAGKIRKMALSFQYKKKQGQFKIINPIYYRIFKARDSIMYLYTRFKVNVGKLIK